MPHAHFHPLMKKIMIIIAALFTATAIAQAATDPTIPAKFLYHSGKREYLSQDIKAGTVPMPEWAEFIMGDKTSYDLPLYRRGLYGSEFASETLMYAANALDHGARPWLMRIQIKEQCRSPERVDPSNFRVQATSRFSGWLSQSGLLATALAKECIEEGIWEPGPPYFASNRTPTERAHFERCGQVIDRYFREKNIALVADTAYGGSWYLRDQSCIESIQGTPEQILEWEAKDALGLISWESERYNAWGGFSILLQVLSEVDLSGNGASNLLQTYLDKLFADYSSANGGDAFVPWASSSTVQSNAIELTVALIQGALHANKIGQISQYRAILVDLQKVMFDAEEKSATKTISQALDRLKRLDERP